MNITIIGAGYVGLNCGVSLAYLGHRVNVVEKSQTKLHTLQKGESPIHEHGLGKLLEDDTVQSCIAFTDDLGSVIPGSEIVIIAVGTPPMSNGQADVKFVEDAAREIASKIAPDQTTTVVVKSTVPIGTNRRVRCVLNETIRERGIKAGIHCASNPEFLREGKALIDMLYPDRIVIGVECACAEDQLRLMYKPILDQSFNPPSMLPRPAGLCLPGLVVTNFASAEMIKYASNAFLATKISFINEIAGLCDRVGADVNEVSYGMGLDHRIGGSFLQAGIGWGGSCFPKDTAALISMAAEHKYPLQMISAAIEVNQRQKTVIIDKLQTQLMGVRGRTIGVLGLAFKPGTDDVRDSPALDIISSLLDRGAYVRAHDPAAMDTFSREFGDMHVTLCDDADTVAMGSDALLVITDWQEYREMDWSRVSAASGCRLIIDGRNCLDVPVAEAAGFKVIGIGR